jgi:DNA gyrase subunit A
MAKKDSSGAKKSSLKKASKPSVAPAAKKTVSKKSPAPKTAQKKNPVPSPTSKKTSPKEAQVAGLMEAEGQDGDGHNGDVPIAVNGLGGNILPRPIAEEMKESYLNYAMSVIVMRALPDVRDGLKPVHRRILYAMHDIGLGASSKFKKSATVVGEVLGKYHPHGDTAVYDSMVRMAQEFSMRYQLVNGQGNFGSMDGDNAAAMRYTEAKMQKIAEEMLADIGKETVDFRPNYDGNHLEPNVMPTKIPQLLLNGTVGIAVGMATNIPPHNLHEVVDSCLHLIDNPDASIDDLMKHLKGPDFPTGGIIYDKNAIKTMYATGRGGIVVRSVAEIQEMKNGRSRIVVSEIPYQVNKANLVIKIADLVRDKKIAGISDLRDESGRKEQVRIVIELKKDAFPQKVLNLLYKMTPLQTSFNMNLVALVDGLQPQLLNLKQCLDHFILHRKEVVTRRAEYDLRIATARAHILEGLKKALDNIDKIIALIKKSKDRADARENLMKKFKFTEIQGNAILDMRLQTLAGLERKKIEDELKDIQKLIRELEALLGSEKKIFAVIQQELLEIKETYGDKRRTKVVAHAVGEFSAKDTIPNEPMIIALTVQNYIKRIHPSSFKSQRRGGKGVIGAKTKEEDEITQLMFSRNHEEMLFFTNLGRVYRLPVYEIPQASKTAKGTAIVNILNLQPGEKVTTMLPINEEAKPEDFLIMATIKGTVKKTAMKDFENVRKNGMIAIKIKDGDSLNWVRYIGFQDHIMMITSKGKGIHFEQTEVRPMGRASQGVRGMRLKDDDAVVDMSVIKDFKKDQLFVIMENGLGKATPVKEYRVQSRGGSGIKTANVSNKTGAVVGARVLSDREGDLIIISNHGQTLRMHLREIPTQGRATQGVYLMRLAAKDHVASVSIVPNLEEVLEELKESVQESVAANMKSVAA